ncbi:hypothetical protein CY34DRAFT_689491 [Suillus luteus UH-Slu-Lm8-n1]|uniref:DUF6533 domain-containing protein n=1 Tax=Suillus luteus UH-Slu-Lm8-n1 TaxID=930992 RepID=A0A0D0AHC2_9AGAM|nr:hypothetical protein CY34DRAFT_689491 [Suillus luteus UH-Slu-Lm8-n1]
MFAIQKPSGSISISNDPSWWPIINSFRLSGYFTFASSTALIYDWVLTFGQEAELIWNQRWSLMTVLYLSIRYVGIPYYIINIMMSSSVTDVVSAILYSTLNWINVIVSAMLGVITVARLHAMYQGSREMLIFLSTIFLIVNIACGVIAAIVLRHMTGDDLLLISMTWILTTIWEVLALCLSVWIAVKHFRDLRRLGPSTGSTIGDCFRVLLKSHVVYFASFVAVCCSALNIQLSPKMFVLGPRLILSIRAYHSKLVADSDEENSMRSIVFQEHVYLSRHSIV